MKSARFIPLHIAHFICRSQAINKLGFGSHSGRPVRVTSTCRRTKGFQSCFRSHLTCYMLAEMTGCVLVTQITRRSDGGHC
jgi:hypothetical protein